MLPSAVVLVFAICYYSNLSLIHAGTIAATNDSQYLNQTIHCADNEPCTVLCQTLDSCKYATILCPVSQPCDVKCNETRACDKTVIHAEHSTFFRLLDCTQGSWTCRGVTIYFPPNNQGVPVGRIIGGDFSLIGYGKPFEFYAQNGWKDVSVTTDPVFKFTEYHLGTMHCISKYNQSSSCDFAPDAWACVNWNDTCNNPHRTDPPSTSAILFPTLQPTHDPTHNPSKTPSKNPSKDPVFAPTLSPTHVPTWEPSNDPTPAPSATLSLTNRPTMNPTTPTQNPTTPSNPLSFAPSYTPTQRTQTPTKNPTVPTTLEPTVSPSKNPTLYPTNMPTVASDDPTVSPSTTSNLTVTPSNVPTTADPTLSFIRTTSNPSVIPTIITTVSIIMDLTNALNEEVTDGGVSDDMMMWGIGGGAFFVAAVLVYVLCICVPRQRKKIQDEVMEDTTTEQQIDESAALVTGDLRQQVMEKRIGKDMVKARSQEGINDYETIETLLKECDAVEYVDNFKKNRLTDKVLRKIPDTDEIWRELIQEYGVLYSFKELWYGQDQDKELHIVNNGKDELVTCEGPNSNPHNVIAMKDIPKDQMNDSFDNSQVVMTVFH